MAADCINMVERIVLDCDGSYKKPCKSITKFVFITQPTKSIFLLVTNEEVYGIKDHEERLEFLRKEVIKAFKWKNLKRYEIQKDVYAYKSIEGKKNFFKMKFLIFFCIIFFSDPRG